MKYSIKCLPLYCTVFFLVCGALFLAGQSQCTLLSSSSLLFFFAHDLRPIFSLHSLAQ